MTSASVVSSTSGENSKGKNDFQTWENDFQTSGYFLTEVGYFPTDVILFPYETTQNKKSPRLF